MTLQLVPVRFADACKFVEAHHRHHRPPVGMKFCIGVAEDRKVSGTDELVKTLVGVAIVGRPVARHYDTGETLEVNRTATDGTRHANSMLYGAAWRAAQAMGYTRLITMTQADETGASLRAAGWRVVAERPAHKGWSVPSRLRPNDSTAGMPRTLWEVSA